MAQPLFSSLEPIDATKHVEPGETPVSAKVGFVPALEHRIPLAQGVDYDVLLEGELDAQGSLVLACFIGEHCSESVRHPAPAVWCAIANALSASIRGEGQEVVAGLLIRSAAADDPASYRRGETRLRADPRMALVSLRGES